LLPVYKLQFMKAYVFPGQASQFPGMGKDLYDQNDEVKRLFNEANEILGFDLGQIMFTGSEEDLKQTKVTQPAVFLHSMATVLNAGSSFMPDMVAGHSLGEFSALVAAGALDFKEGMELVKVRATAMQKACEMEQSTMAAVIGLEDAVVEDICRSIDDEVIPANYNCPGQLVISGSQSGIEKAIALSKEKGARMALELKVGGAFHSSFMEPARAELEQAINDSTFKMPQCPIYQNVTAQASINPEEIKSNLIKQLTAPVRWTQSMLNMIEDGAERFIEVGGNGKTLVGFVKRIDRKFPTEAL
jgi:[acyl-carrier-protein] S-malonyltransferase